jgi:chromosome partitioning protein
VRLNQYGARVLFIDTDGQGNLSSALGYQVTGQEAVLYHLIEGSASIQDSIITIGDSLGLIPSDFDNAALDFLLTTKRVNLQHVITNLIEPIRDKYDFIIFDCNPALSSLNVAIALASSKVIIPVNPDNFSQRGLERTVEEFSRVAKEYRCEINYQLLFTLHDAREIASRKYLLEYLTKYNDRIFSSVIRRNADVKNAIDQKQSIFEMKRAVAREDFEHLTQEVLGLGPCMEVSAHA